MRSQQAATAAWSRKCRGGIRWLPVMDRICSVDKEEARVDYINAGELLPPALVRELQRYVQGGYLYVPADRTRKKRWGERSGYRQELERRNRAIRQAYRQGAAVEKLADAYALSQSAIRKIIYQTQR